jgi:glycerol kinase
MIPGLILAIDQGTTNTKALLLNAGGEVLARASRPQSQNYPHPAWVEQDPLAIWRSVQEVIDECLHAAANPSLAAVAITNQRETIMLWERRTGRPLGPCVVWQCRRTASFCEDLRARGLESLLRERTGLTIDPLFSATKARWLLDSIEDGCQRAEQGGLFMPAM